MLLLHLGLLERLECIILLHLLLLLILIRLEWIALHLSSGKLLLLLHGHRSLVLLLHRCSHHVLHHVLILHLLIHLRCLLFCLMREWIGNESMDVDYTEKRTYFGGWAV